MSKSSIHSSFAVDATGKPLASASVLVQTMTLTGGLGVVASIYSDATLSTPLANPFTADALGNYTFYAAPGLYFVEVMAGGQNKTYTTVLAPLTPNGTVSADEYSGGSVSAKIDAAITDLAGSQGVVLIPASMGSGWPLNGVPTNAPIWDMRGNGGSTQGAFVNGTSLYGRVTAVGSGLQIPSTLLLEHDAYSGGVNQYPTGAATKTQFQALRIQMLGRTIGERKCGEYNLWATGKGDNIGLMASTWDFGGYSTGGDEGSEGGRFMTTQGDGTSGGGIPTGTVASVSSNTITGTWTGGTNANIGEQRPLINTSRSVYSTGTIASVSGAGSPVVCTVVGSGTGWSALGTGAKTDLFLEITGNSNGAIKWVVPVLSITDDTHLVIEYNLAELGATTLGATMVTSGAYHIFKGGIVNSLSTPPSGSLNATAVILASGGSNFIAGDSIQQPLGYNYHGWGLAVDVSRWIGDLQGGGLVISNNNTVQYSCGVRVIGNFQKGISFDTGSISGDLMFTNAPVTGCLLRQSDTTLATQNLIGILNSGGGLRTMVYDRTNDMFHIGNGFFTSCADTRISTNSNPQANTQFYLGYNNAAYSGLVVGPVTAPSSNSVKPLDVRLSTGFTAFAVEKDRVVLGESMDLKGFSDHESTGVWSIAGATGNAAFNRLSLNTGSAVVAGDIAVGAGWGSTASISGLVGHDGAFQFTITANGTGLAINPSFTMTYHDGTWTNAPIVIATLSNTSASGATIAPVLAVPTATTVTVTAGSIVPSAGQTFTFSVITVGR